MMGAEFAQRREPTAGEASEAAGAALNDGRGGIAFKMGGSYFNNCLKNFILFKKNPPRPYKEFALTIHRYVAA